MNVKHIRSTLKTLFTRLVIPAAAAMSISAHAAQPLKIGYSDWPGWVAWQVAIDKGWFKEAGVPVDFEWFDYSASMDAYSAGKIDAVLMTNGDALVTGAAGGKSVMIMLTDYSNGNDMIVAKPGIKSLKELKGKKVAVEQGLVEHLADQAALGGGGVVRDVRSESTLAAFRAVDVEFGDVDRQAERLHFAQRLVLLLEARRRNVDVRLRADRHDRDLLFLERLDQRDELAALGRVLQPIVVIAEDRVRVRFVGVLKSLGDEVRPDDLEPRRLPQGPVLVERLVDHVPLDNLAAEVSDDGMDVVAMESVAKKATAAIRAGQGPFFLEARTYRFRAHSMYDPELYRPKEEVERWKLRDPIPALAAALRGGGLRLFGRRRSFGRRLCARRA